MRILVDRDVAVPMGDGVSLATDVYRPDGDSPAPAILMRLPYDKAATLMVNSFFDVMRGVQAGYAVVVQDTRGRYASEGTFNPFADEAAEAAIPSTGSPPSPGPGRRGHGRGVLFRRHPVDGGRHRRPGAPGLVPPSPPTSTTRAGRTKGVPSSSGSTCTGRCRPWPWARPPGA